MAVHTSPTAGLDKSTKTCQITNLRRISGLGYGFGSDEGYEEREIGIGGLGMKGGH